MSFMDLMQVLPVSSDCAVFIIYCVFNKPIRAQKSMLPFNNLEKGGKTGEKWNLVFGQNKMELKFNNSML